MPDSAFDISFFRKPAPRVARVIYVATKNAGKLRELTAILGRAGHAVATYPEYGDVAEGDVSYAANAALKARALRAQLFAAGMRVPVIGDDSGLEVAALGGRPGVRSARYGGEAATWSERRTALLAEVAREAPSDRRARFVCALHFIAADGSETCVQDEYPGTLAEAERGTAGFSYDSIFEISRGGRTFAEIDEDEKNRISHRARAVAALVAALRERPDFMSANGNGESSGT